LSQFADPARDQVEQQRVARGQFVQAASDAGALRCGRGDLGRGQTRGEAQARGQVRPDLWPGALDPGAVP
jgi:hypothetical protein